MNDQTSHKPVDHLAEAGQDAASFAANLWQAGGDCFEALARGCGDVVQTVGVAAATITEETITFAANCADAAGHAISSGVDSAVEVAKAIARENDITPVAKAIIEAPGAMLDAYQRREAEFRADRPLTAQIESILPPLEAIHAIIAGGKSHPASESVTVASSHLSPAAGGEGKSSATEIHRPVQNGVATRSHAGIPGRPGTGSTDSNGHGEISNQVKRGDTYWGLARELVGENATNQEVLKTMKNLQKLNHNRPLHGGDLVIVEQY
ncbi:MAG: hypothetical protein JSS86_14550 [Cyanobacteria bacterium SZAS LIN-2]|nr:hypothetical protein [Cyanobacteria bacterium SZAS LIN-3]MBS1997537.1 hypothetical protein [Cyanobacteria bacterium SZAS LIN-2]